MGDSNLREKYKTSETVEVVMSEAKKEFDFEVGEIEVSEGLYNRVFAPLVFSSPQMEGDIDVVFDGDKVDKVTISIRNISDKKLHVFEGTPDSSVETVMTPIP